ncbi:MAG: TetR/AcrR family transcriptional regulator [Candidatus Marinimicrobia bacterium]|nr:TetR/AcrR family transcriptional regulator [Candidatus Neomarinimicrobiota bacterium]
MKHNENTKEKIIGIAIECFGELGYDGTSMRLIAEKSGVSKPAIYYYFPDKEKLFVGVVEFVVRKFQSQLENIKNSNKNTLEKLEAILLSPFKPTKNRATIRRFMNSIFTSGIKINMHFDHHKMFESQQKIIHDIIQQGIDEGIFSANIDVKVFMYGLIGTMNLFSRDHILDDAPPINKKLADQILKQFFEGVGKHSENNTGESHE